MPQHTDQHEPTFPPAFASELRAAYCDVPAVPEAVDRAVLAAARQRGRHIAALRARRRVIARIAAISAVGAAAAVITLMTLQPWSGHPGTAKSPAAALAAADPRDVNGDGVVDILDAFAVARAVEVGSAEERKVRAAAKAWDFNHDGVIDRRDADAVAVSVVRLTPGRG
jgi:hypothetical protein